MKSPFNKIDVRRGGVVAVKFQKDLYCYVREYALCHGFLPFFSTSVLPMERLPEIKAQIHFDLLCHDSDKTPMSFVGWFPFTTPEDSYGHPCYTLPDLIDNCFTIHEMHNGKFRIRETKDESEILGMRQQRRFHPNEFIELLRDRIGVWKTLQPT